MIVRESMKTVIRIILAGITLHERSWDVETSLYKMSLDDAMTQVAGGDDEVGFVAYLMAHNSNDIEISAQAFGIGYGPNGEVIDLPEQNCPEDHWAEWDIQSQTWVYKPKNKLYYRDKEVV